MTIQKSGPWCDICANPIIPYFNESINPFSCKGIEKTLHCCDDCLPVLKKAMKKKDWKLLPSGPLRKVFEENKKGAQK